jgi:hypothetical protein
LFRIEPEGTKQIKTACFQRFQLIHKKFRIPTGRSRLSSYKLLEQAAQTIALANVIVSPARGA